MSSWILELIIFFKHRISIFSLIRTAFFRRIILIFRLTRTYFFKHIKALEKISKELMQIVWHPQRWWNFACQKMRKKN